MQRRRRTTVQYENVLVEATAVFVCSDPSFFFLFRSFRPSSNKARRRALWAIAASSPPISYSTLPSQIDLMALHHRNSVEERFEDASELADPFREEESPYEDSKTTASSAAASASTTTTTRRPQRSAAFGELVCLWIFDLNTP